MKYLVFIVILYPCLIYSQKNDFIWITGIDYLPSQPGIENLVMDFNSNQLTYSVEDKKIRFDGTNANYNSDSGQLILYTNGCQIYNADGTMVPNSDSLNIGYAYKEFCTGNLKGYRTIDNSLLLPKPDGTEQKLYYISDGNYYQFQPTLIAYTARLSYNVIDITASNGKGAVIEKNVPVFFDTLTGGQVEAVRHGNGRDWWICVPTDRNNLYHFLLLDNNGLKYSHKQNIGLITNYQTICNQAVFSPNGNKYARYDQVNKLFVMDFDRCNGSFSNFQYLNTDTVDFFDDANCSGLAFSQDSRFLYVANGLELQQYDMSSSDWPATKIIVGQARLLETFYRGYISWCTLAPDGKIYFGNGNGTKYMHILHHPEKIGMDSQFEHLLQLKTAKWGFPNHPNFRLGPLDGSPCDTLGINNIPWAHWRWEGDTIATLSVYFRDLSAYEPDTWFWDFGDGTTSTERSPNHIFPKGGVYHVCLTVSNQYGTDTFCREVTVSGTPVVDIFNEIKMEVFPNPASDQITLQLTQPLPSEAKFQLFSITGQSVFLSKIESGTVGTVIELPESLSNGLYFWHISIGKSAEKSGRLIVLKN